MNLHEKGRFFKYIHIDYLSATPKYIQLANAVIKAIHDGKVEKNDILPSINEVSFEFEISRDTTEKGLQIPQTVGDTGIGTRKGIFYSHNRGESAFKNFPAFQ